MKKQHCGNSLQNLGLVKGIVAETIQPRDEAEIVLLVSELCFLLFSSLQPLKDCADDCLSCLMRTCFEL